jgi:hypothetical protein
MRHRQLLLAVTAGKPFMLFTAAALHRVHREVLLQGLPLS